MPRLLQFNPNEAKYIKITPKTEIDLKKVVASRNIFKGTETMIELRGWLFRLLNW